jgi:hypothetical protein
MKATYFMQRKSGYGQYNIVKETAKGKITKVHCTDSQMYDDFSDGKCSQKRLKSQFESYLKN